MKPYLKWIPLAAAVLGMGALFGTTYFVTHYGIVIKNPDTDAITGHWNGTNGIVTAGGAEFSGAVLTTSTTTNGPAANELVTAEWSRTHFAGNGAFFYNSTNLAASAFDPGNTYQYVGSYPTNGSRSYTPAAGAYFGSVITTNRFQQINGPALIQVYLTSSGGAASAQYTVHPEIYYTYDTNSATLLGDFEAADQAVIHGAITNRYDFVVSFPPIISTNANGFWLVRRFKVGTKNGTDTLKLSLGTNSVSLATSTPSSISFTTPALAGANWVSSGSSDSTLPGTATVTNLVASGIVSAASVLGSVNGVINVKSPPYSCAGDGVTDDTGKLQNACTNPGVIYFPPGTYITSGIKPTNSSLLIGSGFDSKLKFIPGSATSSLIDCAQNSVSISDMSLDGGTNLAFNANSYGNNSTGIVHYVVGDVYVKNVQVNGFTAGIRLTGPNSTGTRLGNSLYTGNFLTNCYTGFWCDTNNAAEYTAIQNNVVRGTYIALFNNSAANVLFTGNRLHDGNTGIYSYKPPSGRGHSLYIGNLINHYVIPIFVNLDANSYFGCNDILGGGTSTITVTGGTNCVFQGNLLEMGTTAFTFSGGLGNIIKDNKILGGGTALSGATAAISVFSGNLDVNGVDVWSGTSGTATVANGSTTVDVTHGLATTPVASDILLTPQNNLGNAAKFWVSAVAATTFTISVNADPGATTAIFSWRHVK